MKHVNSTSFCFSGIYCSYFGKDSLISLFLQGAVTIIITHQLTARDFNFITRRVVELSLGGWWGWRKTEDGLSRRLQPMTTIGCWSHAQPPHHWLCKSCVSLFNYKSRRESTHTHRPGPLCKCTIVWQRPRVGQLTLLKSEMRVRFKLKQSARSVSMMIHPECV